MKKTCHWLVGLSSSVLLSSILIFMPAPARAQLPPNLARIGILSLPSPADGNTTQRIVKALHDFGYVDGKNAVVDARYADWKTDRLPALAAELENQRADVIIAVTNLAGFAARDATRRVPIVVWGIHGAVEAGLVTSLARPGGRVTGMETLATAVDAKRLEIIKQVVPQIVRLGVVYNAEDQGSPVHLASLREVSRALGIRIVPLPVRRAEDFDGVLSSQAAASIDGVLTLTDEVTAAEWGKVAGFVSKHRLPSICEFRFLIQFGCMLAYGPPLEEFTLGIVRQVDKILKGAKAGDLPVEQVTRFEFLVNVKAASAIGIAVPKSVLLRADEVIE
jgi:putative ABC transport system substrate-binding protein